MKVSELPVTEKPGFKLRYFGAGMLSNAELIQILTGVKDLEAASEILTSSGGLPFLHKTSIEEFETIEGIGESMASRLVAAMELGRRSMSLDHNRTTRIFAADDVYKMFAPEALAQHQEVVSALLLNPKYEVIGKEYISKGGIVTAQVEPCDVFRPAIKRGATGVIMVHNHPSGDPTPSEDDIYSTKRISQCGELIGVKLIDHIVIGHGRFSSMRDMQMMEFGDFGNSKVAEEKDRVHERGMER